MEHNDHDHKHQGYCIKYSDQDHLQWSIVITITAINDKAGIKLRTR